VPPSPATTACERWFVRRGVPHFIVHYDAGEDIWTRALPLLVVIYLLRGLYALDLDERLGFNLLATLLVVGVLFATWAVANVVAGRPAFSRPRRIGGWELFVFVVGPEIPPLVLGQWTDALKAMVLGVLTLLVVYLGTSYGVIPMIRWAGERTASLLGSLRSVISRALPLLLLTITFLFWTNEVWQVMGSLHGPTYWMVLGLFFVIGGGFVFSRLPGDVRAAGTLDSWDEVRDLAEGTPAAAIELPADGAPPSRELSRRQYVNVALVGLFARTMQVLAVTVAAFSFLVVLGVLAISDRTTASWVQAPANVLVSWTLGGRDMVLTEELMRVAGFLATFTGLTFTIYLVTDPTYREEFRTDLASEVREAFAVRAAYLSALESPVP
jgi:hypothetical protein